MVVAVDGPVGSGKSSICKLVAKELGFVYLDSGAMYRASAYILQHLNLHIDNLSSALEKTVFTFSDNGGRLSVFIDGKREDVTNRIRTPEISEITSSLVAKNSAVREILVAKQQEVARMSETEGISLIADGRDMGTKVFPNAQCKIYLDASPEVRAQRRLKDYQRQGLNITFEQVLTDLVSRDHGDTTRVDSPLMVANGAVVLDTSDMTLEESIQAMVDIITSK